MINDLSNNSFSIVARTLSKTAFALYGDVVEIKSEGTVINQGSATRYEDLAKIKVDAEGGRPAISIVSCSPEANPIKLRLLERHPLGSQIFIPMDRQRYLIIVGPPGRPPEINELQAFVANGRQGVHYRAGTWHHPLIALDNMCDFIEFHRVGPGENYDEIVLKMPVLVQLPTS